MDLYAEIILDHFKYPRNYGVLDHADLEAEDFNPLCGDRVKLGMNIDENKKIAEVKFSGEGCAISKAATSLLTEELVGKTLEEVAAISNEHIYELLGTEIAPARVKCALLGIGTAKKAILLYQHS